MNKATKWYAGPLYVIIAVALVAGLTLVPGMVPTLAPVAGPIVEASSVSSVTVNVSNTTQGGNATYIINFTTNVALTPTASDTITIEFPTGTTSGTNISGLSTTYALVGNATTNATRASAVNIGGKRLSLTVAAVVYAGHVTVILNNTLIQNPRPQGNYTLKVYTTQETAAVTSSPYIIDTIISVCTVNNTWNQSVNVTTGWSFNFSPATAMVANADKITIIFPATTTLPTSITSTSNVTIDQTALDYVTDWSVSGQNLTLTVPEAINTTKGKHINITNLTGLRNPTDIRTNWTVGIYTTKDRGIKTSATFCTSAGNMSHISYLEWSGWDTYIHNNTNSSSVFKIVAKDVFGNNATVNKTTTLALGSDGGTFYLASSGAAIGTIDIAYAEGASCATAVLYYRSKVPGTKTLTASEVVTQGWTAASKSITISPNVQLWNSGGSIVGNYSTITAAEAAAVPYDTIKVLPGTYVPSATITINVAYLTLESTGGASQTIINATNSGVGVDGGGINIYAKGVTVDGFTVANAPASCIYLRDADNATIKNNILTNSTAEVSGVDVSWYSTGVTVSDNQFNKWTTIWLHGSNCTVSNNTNVRSSIWMPQPGQTLNKVYFTNNNITSSSTAGIFLYGYDSSAKLTDSVIRDNTISNHAYGILVKASASEYLNLTNLTISGNTITDNTVDGINITVYPTWNADNCTIQNNNIYNNANWGINNHNLSATITATLNYWGNATGPCKGTGTYASSAIGSGDNVTTRVTYSPWLSAAYPGGQSTTGLNLTLTKNWNFISVPKKLENATFGWLLSGQDISQSYGYDPSTGWTILTGSSPVEVLAGYWISANAAGTMRLTFVSTGQGVPATKDLTGNKWNAIGFSDTTAATANATLKSVQGSWSTALGWNATTQIYDSSIVYQVSDSTNMTPGKGYWLWMTANDTLSALSA